MLIFLINYSNILLLVGLSYIIQIFQLYPIISKNRDELYLVALPFLSQFFYEIFNLY